ncbi:DUF697 domain-containing protein, partial [Ralstonia pseudosolanacearum]|uniref:DUF697 domain-containing protein n=1 Tax=Ralstonia pseudosolanacearum TaxID=1310165 RepID=UPI003CF7E869
LAAWDYVTSLLSRAPILGWIATVLIGLLMLVLLIIGFRELAAFGRLRKLDAVQTRARDALLSNDLKSGHGVLDALDNLYAGRADVAWGKAELAQRKGDMLDADALLALADLITALTANLRMIRRIAEIYGGRAGTLGSWRLTRGVLSHLVATGAL